MTLLRLFTKQTRAVQRILVVWFIILFVAILNFTILAPPRDEDGGNIDDDVENLLLKRHENDVPIVVVDQHQEVIPYWYKAVKEKIISSQDNILIHIDAHSDMAPPDNADIIKKFIFNRHQNLSSNSYLPLMQANDRFIVSAIMTGLINRIVWLKPDWDKPKNEAVVNQGHVGTTIYGQTDGKRRTCACLQEFSVKANKPRSKHQCFYFREDSVNGTHSKFTIPKKACRKMKPFRFITLSESRFRKVYKTKNLRSGSIILDIDEDYFGVQSGVQAFIDAGLSLDEIYMLNEMLSNVYCPKSIEHEIALNEQLQKMFAGASEMKRTLTDLTSDYISTKTSQYFCINEATNDNLELLELYLKTLPSETLKILSTLKYCNTNSFRLLKTFQADNKLDLSSSFTLCHGTIFPEDTLNQIFLDSQSGIQIRAHNLTVLLDDIFSRAKPGLFTIARSLRDGFTPRKQQRLIEVSILNHIKKVLEKRKLSEHIIYDKYLVFGKSGWKVK